MPSLFRLRFAYKRNVTKSGNQSRGLLCSSIQELATNKKPKNKAPHKAPKAV
jgi:hypothetical protein